MKIKLVCVLLVILVVHCNKNIQPQVLSKLSFVEHFPQCTHKFQLVNNGLTILCAGPDQRDQNVKFKILRRSLIFENFTTFQTFQEEFIEISQYSHISKDGLMFGLYTLIQVQGLGNLYGWKIYYAQNYDSRYNIISSNPYVDKPSHISDNHQYVFTNHRSHKVLKFRNHPTKLILNKQIQQPHGQLKQTYNRISNDGNAVVLFMRNNIYIYHRESSQQDFKIAQYTMESIDIKESSLDANFDNMPVIYISGSKLSQLFIIKFNIDTQQFSLIREFKSSFCDASICHETGYAQWSSLSRNSKFVSFANRQFYQLSSIQDDKVNIQTQWQKTNISQINDLYFSDSQQQGYEYQTFRDSKTGGYVYKLYTGFTPNNQKNINEEQGTIDCSSDELWDQINSFNDSCGCAQGAIWNFQTFKCQQVCNNGVKVIQDLQNSKFSECLCKQKYIWNEQYKQCVFDCKNYGGYSLGNQNPEVCICQRGAQTKFGSKECVSTRCVEKGYDPEQCSYLGLQNFKYVQQYPQCIHDLQLSNNGLIALCTGISSENTKRAIVWTRQTISDEFTEFQILPPQTESSNQITKDGKMIIVTSTNQFTNKINRHIFYTELPNTLYSQIQIFYDQKQKIAISDNHQYLVYTTESNIKILKFKQHKFQQVNFISGSFKEISCLYISNNGNTIFVGTQTQGYLYHRINHFSNYTKNDLRSGFNSCAVNINTYPSILLAGSVKNQTKNQLLIGTIQLQSSIFTQIKRFSFDNQQGQAYLSIISGNGEYIGFFNDKYNLFGRIDNGQFQYLKRQQILEKYFQPKTAHFFYLQQQGYVYLTFASVIITPTCYLMKIKSNYPLVSYQKINCLNDTLWDGRNIGDFSCGCLDGAEWDISLKRCVQLCQNPAQDLQKQSCICQDNFFWSYKQRQCVIEICEDSDNILNLRQRKGYSECLCEDYAFWNEELLRCQFDCMKIDNAVGNNGSLACNCQEQFEWDGQHLECKSAISEDIENLSKS